VEPRIERLVEIVRLTCGGQKETKVVNVLLGSHSHLRQIGKLAKLVPCCLHARKHLFMRWYDI
jgi:hypothetical protein